MDKRCMSCMQLMGEYDVCMHCGWIEGSPPVEPCHLVPGTVLRERYIIGKSIGFGGFGITYIAWDNAFNRRVAVKEFYPAGLVNRAPGESKVVVYSDNRDNQYEQQKQRFLAEARTMAKLSGVPNIVEVVDFFTENNTAYIVMEYLEGITLKQYLKQSGGRLPLPTAMAILAPVCDALIAVHKAGIVHRDVAPDNIMITVDNRIKLFDFGAARLSKGEDEKTMTIILKPGYAPPEQYRSKSRQGAFTDVYALGAVMYRMITGVVPEESVDRMLNDELQPPCSVCPELPPALDSIILRAMALNSDVRFKTIREFWDALCFQKQTDLPHKLLKKKRIRRTLIAAAAVMVMALAGGYIYYANTSLKPATVEVWLPQGADADEDAALQALFSLDPDSNESIVIPFCEEYRGMAVNVTFIPAEQYAAKIRAASLTNTMPDLFMVEEYDPYYDEYTCALDSIINDLGSAVSDYYALDNYETYFPSGRCLPTGMDTAILYYNGRINNEYEIGLSEARFTGYWQLGLALNHTDHIPFAITSQDMFAMLTLSEGENYAAEVDEAQLAYRGYRELASNKRLMILTGNSIYADESVIEAIFSRDEDNEWSENLLCYVGSIAEYSRAQSYLPGYCEASPIAGSGAYPVILTNLWCVGDNGDDDRQIAAERLLAKLLSEQAQLILNVEGDSLIPIQRDAAHTYFTSIYPMLGFFEDELDDALFIGEDLPAARARLAGYEELS